MDRFFARKLYNSQIIDCIDLKKQSKAKHIQEIININLGGSKRNPDFVSGIKFYQEDSSGQAIQVDLSILEFPIRSQLLSWYRIYSSNEGLYSWGL